MNGAGTKYDLSPIWDALLELYSEFEKICQRHGLRYYLGFGSVLGAVRHHGFIPWDDDLDIVMPRPDYEKFLALPQAELPDWVRIDSILENPDYHRLFAKVVDTRHSRVVELQRKTGYELSQGIFIDIFPLDGVGTGKPCLWWFCFKRKIHWTLGVYYSAVRPDMKHWPHYVCGWLLSLFHPEIRNSVDVLHHMDWWAKRYSFSDREYSSYVFYSVPRFFEPGVFSNPKLVEFEGRTVPIPKKSELYLTLEYGDYMKLPPKSEQRPNHQKAMWAK